MDPNIEKFSLIERNVHGTLSAYKQICDEKNKQIKQITMYIFLKGGTLLQVETQAGPSRGILEEGIVTTGDDRKCLWWTENSQYNFAHLILFYGLALYSSQCLLEVLIIKSARNFSYLDIWSL